MEYHSGVELGPQSGGRCRDQPGGRDTMLRSVVYLLSDGEPVKEMLWKDPHGCR